MDMSTINLSGVTNGALQECVTRFNEGQGVDGVKATLSTTETGLVISLGEGANRTQISITGVPELDLPDMEAAEDAVKQLEDLAEKLTELAESLKNGAAGDPKTPSVNDVVDGIGSAILDIYLMIMLLLEVAQEQHKLGNLISIQTFENKSALMQANADSIRARADEGFKLGLASAIVQSVMVTASAVMVGISVGYTIADAKSSEVGGAKDNLKAAQDQLKSLQEGSQTELPGIKNEDMEAMGLKPQKTEQENLEAFKKEFMPHTVEAEKNTADAKVEMDAKVSDVEKAQDTLKGAADYEIECKGKAEQAGKDLETAQKAVNENAQQIADKKIEIQKLEADNPKDEAAINKAKGELAELEAKQPGLQKSLEDAVNAKTQADQNLAEAVKSRNDAQTDLEKAQDAAVKAKGAYADACTKQLDATKKDLAKITEDIKVQTKGAEAAAKDTKTVEQKNDEARQEVVKGEKQAIEMEDLAQKAQEQEEQQGPDLQKAQDFAEQVEKSNKGSLDTKSAEEGLEARINKCKFELDKAWERLGNSENAKLAGAFKAIGDVVNQLSNAVTAFMNTYKEQNQAEGEAERKITDSEIEQKSATQEQAKDLAQTAAEEIRKLLQMLGDLAQSMKQVQRDIFS